MATSYNSDTQYTRKLDDIRGIDITSPDTEVEPYRLAYAQNVYRNYNTGMGTAIETVPGYRCILSAPEQSAAINGIWTLTIDGVRKVLVHRGTDLLMFDYAERDNLTDGKITVIPGLAAHRSSTFVLAGNIYILDGTHYYKLQGNSLIDVTSTAYLPVTYINGEMYEQRNMLIDRTVNRDTQPAEANWHAFFMLDEVSPSDKSKFRIERFRTGYSADIAVVPHGWVDGGAFSGNTDIKQAVILGSISTGAFAQCTALEEVYTSRTLGGSEFEGCISLKTVKLRGVGIASPLPDSPVETVYLGTSGNLTVTDDTESLGVTPVFPRAVRRNLTAYIDRQTYDRTEAATLAEAYKVGHVTLNGVEIVSNTAVPIMGASTEVPPDGYIFPDGTDAEGVPCSYDTDDYQVLIPGKGRRPLSFAGAGNTLVTEDEGSESLLYVGDYIVYDSSEYSDASSVTIKVGAIDDNYYELKETTYAPDTTISIITNTPTPEIFDADPDAEGVDRTDYTIREIVCYDPAESVERVMIDDRPADCWGVVWHTIDGKRYVDRVLMTNNPNFDGKDTDVTFNCYPSELQTSSNYLDFSTGNPDYHGTTIDAICQCTLCAVFDGRVFFAGNPALPNTLFWCSRDLDAVARADYFGQLNYTNDGGGEHPIVALLSTASMLLALKEDNQIEPTVYYHSGVDTGNDVIPRIYPSEAGVAGVGCTGAATIFLDDAVFLSPRGLEAVGKQQVNLERSLTHRSTYVDGGLTREDLRAAILARWQGYLAIFVPSGNVYLADSRLLSQDNTGAVGYEWWRLEGVGHYRGQTRDYRQSTGDFLMYGSGADPVWFSRSDCRAKYDMDYIPVVMGTEERYYKPSEVYPTRLYVEDGAPEVYYADDEHREPINAYIAIDNGAAVLVEPAERYSGGTFAPVTAAANVDATLLFGTSSGAVFVVNDDKQGVPYAGDYPAEGAIHPHWYTFDGRTIHSVAVTCYDTAGYPGLAKKTVKKSYVLYAKRFANSRISIRVRTNRSEMWRDVGDVSAADYRPGVTDFANAALQLSDEYIVTVREKEKKWAVKQLMFDSGERHMCPIGIYHCSYRFRLAGRVKS